MFTATSSVILWCLGFRLRVEGEAVAREEAPVVICAPHTSFLDVFIIAICRGSPVARIENSRSATAGAQEARTSLTSLLCTSCKVCTLCASTSARYEIAAI